jgi:hypothetical protein
LSPLVSELIPIKEKKEKKGMKRKGTLLNENRKKANKMSKLDLKSINKMKTWNLDMRLKCLGIDKECFEKDDEKKDHLELFYNSFLDERVSELESKFEYNPQTLNKKEKQDLAAL